MTVVEPRSLAQTGISCRCNRALTAEQVTGVRRVQDAEIRTYRCPDCGHELQITVWLAEH